MRGFGQAQLMGRTGTAGRNGRGRSRRSRTRRDWDRKSSILAKRRRRCAPAALLSTFLVYEIPANGLPLSNLHGHRAAKAAWGQDGGRVAMGPKVWMPDGTVRWLLPLFGLWAGPWRKLRRCSLGLQGGRGFGVREGVTRLTDAASIAALAIAPPNMPSSRRRGCSRRREFW